MKQSTNMEYWKEHLFLSRRASCVSYLSLISSAFSGNRQQVATFSRSMENRQNIRHRCFDKDIALGLCLKID